LRDWQVINGDSLEVLRQIPSDALDALVTDPPAGIGFMGREWDSDKGGRVQWIDWLKSVLAEALRVMKPGAHGLIWAIPRTSHWTATAAELAGFEVRDVVSHVFGTGFPKSLNISKAIDEAAGAERVKVRIPASEIRNPKSVGSGHGVEGGDRPWMQRALEVGYHEKDGDEPATDAAKQWAGWGTALKPATEHWILVRKPLAVDGASATVAANVQAYGTGGLNIDACRIGYADAADQDQARVPQPKMGTTPENVLDFATGTGRNGEMFDPSKGRWPANLVLSHTEWCEVVGETTVKGDNRTERGTDGGHFYEPGTEASRGTMPSGKLHGNQVVPVWRCLPGCPVALLDAQSGTLRPGEYPARRTGTTTGLAMGESWAGTKGERVVIDRGGGASRFFYVAKPSGREREEGLAHLPKRTGGEMVERTEGSAGIQNPRAGAGRTSKGRANFHPTVKSIDLMSWLVKLITPPGGVVLDPFCGSGSTGCAAVLGGWDFLGVEKDPDFVRIAEARLTHFAAKAAEAHENAGAVEASTVAVQPDGYIPPAYVIEGRGEPPFLETAQVVPLPARK
jgi:hypothetical protein